MRTGKSIFVKNIYYMLAYAFQTLDSDEYADVETEDFDNAQNLLAAILEKGLSHQLKQGLHKEYVTHVDHLSTLRGKVEMAGTARLRLAQRQSLSCEYDELSANNHLNQILKSTALLLIRHGDVEAHYRDELRRVLLYFSDVDEIDLSQVRWSTLKFGSNNRSYRILVSLCQLIYEGLILTTESGNQRLASFLNDDNMSRLYEKFILEYYRKHRSDLRPAASQIKWALDFGERTMLPTMQSDIMLSKGDDVLIIDAKYYAKTGNTQISFDTPKIHSGNLYQIFTYVKNKEAEFPEGQHRVSGMLLYARTEEETQPDGTFQMSGNRISVRTLDLGKDFRSIENELRRITDEHFAAEG